MVMTVALAKIIVISIFMSQFKTKREKKQQQLNEYDLFEDAIIETSTAIRPVKFSLRI